MLIDRALGGEFLRFSVQQKKFCIKQREISVIESEGRVVYIYHGDEKYRAYQRLNTIEQKLNMKYFLRCNQSYIINVEQVDGVIDYDFHMKNGMVIPIRKRDKKDIVQKYYQKKSELNDWQSGKFPCSKPVLFYIAVVWRKKIILRKEKNESSIKSGKLYCDFIISCCIWGVCTKQIII